MGTPTGTGIPTITFKQGSKAGNYTTTSATFVNVDGTNLALTVTIPTGWKIVILGSGVTSCSNTATTNFIAINDSIAGIVARVDLNIATSNNAYGWAVMGEVNGDGSSHTITLQFAADGTNTVTIQNSASNFPTMIFLMTPSN